MILRSTYLRAASPPAAPAVDVSDVKGSDVDVCLFRNVTIKANNRIVKELSEFGSVKKRTQPNSRPKKAKSEIGQIVSLVRFLQIRDYRRNAATLAKNMERTWSRRVACKIVFQPVSPDPGVPLYEERMIAV